LSLNGEKAIIQSKREEERESRGNSGGSGVVFRSSPTPSQAAEAVTVQASGGKEGELDARLDEEDEEG
jgi:hypothetical protein